MSHENDQLEPGHDDADADLVTVATFHTPVEAEMARERLASEGIPAFLTNAAAVGMMPFLGNDLGGIGLQVTVHNEKTAREILGV